MAVRYILRGSALKAESDAAEADPSITAVTVAFNVKRAYGEVLARREKLHHPRH